MTFDDDATLMKSKKIQTKEEVHEEEPVARIIVEFNKEPIREVEDTPEEYMLEDHDSWRGRTTRTSRVTS